MDCLPPEVGREEVLARLWRSEQRASISTSCDGRVKARRGGAGWRGRVGGVEEMGLTLPSE